jgi:RecA-family ATPase
MSERSCSTPLLITKAQKQRLRDLGYTEAQIREMKPAEAHAILEQEAKSRAAQAKPIEEVDEEPAPFPDAAPAEEQDEPGHAPTERTGAAKAQRAEKAEEEADDDGEPAFTTPDAGNAEPPDLDPGTKYQAAHAAQHDEEQPDQEADGTTATEGDGRGAATGKPNGKAAGATGGGTNSKATGAGTNAKGAGATGSGTTGAGATGKGNAKTNAHKARVARFKLFTLDEIAALPKPVWLIDKFLPEKGLAGIFGKWGSGKSFLALAWALCVAAGIPWQGYSVRQGQVVYVYAEGTAGIDQRVRVWMQQYRVKERPADIRILPVPPNMLDKKDREALIDAIQEQGVKPALIILDTLARCFGGGDENSTRDMNAFIANCDALRESFPDATVLVVHHIGKDDQKGARGSTAFGGALDMAFELKRPNTKLPPVILKNVKAKDSEELPDLELRLEKVTLPDGATSLTVRMLTDDERTEELLHEDLRTPTEKRAAHNLCDTLDTLRNFSNGATFSEWRSASSKSEGTFKDHLRKLKKAGKVRQDGERYYVVEPDETANEDLQAAA